ncbi:hypothetical protein [Roseicyclus sp.]|uniref:hypothetical protein n=1 Tax=Roseicyclus sp. TaxID=1914329 RepID=UPI001BCEBEF5
MLYGNNTFTGDVFVNVGRLEAFSGAAIDDGALVQEWRQVPRSVFQKTKQSAIFPARRRETALSANLTLGVQR